MHIKCIFYKIQINACYAFKQPYLQTAISSEKF